MRTTVRDWKRENAFRRLKLMGISIEDSEYLKAQYRNFQEEDEGILPPPLAELFEEEPMEQADWIPEEFRDKNNGDIKPVINGAVCPVMLGIIMKREGSDDDRE